jgi:hypothetical protein
VTCVLKTPPSNCAVDCYTRQAIEKPTLLAAMRERFGLQFEIAASPNGVTTNATGNKPHYYSLNRTASEFGYEPALSSLDGVLTEMEALLT